MDVNNYKTIGNDYKRGFFWPCVAVTRGSYKNITT